MKNDSDHVAGGKLESAAAPSECGSVPDIVAIVEAAFKEGLALGLGYHSSTPINAILENGWPTSTAYANAFSLECTTMFSDSQIDEIASWLNEAAVDIGDYGAHAPDNLHRKLSPYGAMQFYKACAIAVRGMAAQRLHIESSATRAAFAEVQTALKAAIILCDTQEQRDYFNGVLAALQSGINPKS